MTGKSYGEEKNLVSEADCRELFFVEPFHATDSARESLTSLIIRIARAHAVSPRLMIKEVIGHYFPKIASHCLGTFFRNYSAPINGLGQYATEFSDAISALSSIPNTSHLTLLPLRHVIASRGSPVIYPGLRWCRECYADMVDRGEEVYRPLLWSLSAVDVCPIHHTFLLEHCPICGAKQPIIPRWPDICFCDSCRSCLLYPQSHAFVSNGELPRPWHLAACVDLLRILHTIDVDRAHDNLVVFLKLATKSIANGNQAELCRRTELPEHAIKKWISGRDMPTFESLLRFLYVIDNFPSCALLRTLRPKRTELRIVRIASAESRMHRTSSDGDVEQRLLRALKSDAPESLSVLAASVMLTRSGLKYLFPELCKKVTTRRREIRRKKAQMNLSARYELVAKLADELWLNGVAPNRERIETAGKKQGLALFSNDIREGYLLAMQRLIATQN